MVSHHCGASGKQRLSLIQREVVFGEHNQLPHPRAGSRADRAKKRCEFVRIRLENANGARHCVGNRSGDRCDIRVRFEHELNGARLTRDVPNAREIPEVVREAVRLGNIDDPVVGGENDADIGRKSRDEIGDEAVEFLQSV